MKVKIVKASQPTYWYANNIGETFEVEDRLDSFGYDVINNPNFTHHCIQQRDCEIISDTVKIQFTFSAWDKDRSQKVWTRDGREVRQLTYFESSDYSFAGVINGELEAFTKDGFAIIGNKESLKDLFLEHAEKDYFVNVYRIENGGIYINSDCYDTFNSAESVGKVIKNYIKTINFKV